MDATAKGLAEALGKIPSGIFVVTARKGKEETALLASWVQQASFEPPTLSIGVHKNRPISSFLQEHAAFAVNILSKDNKDLYRRFVKGLAPGVPAFEGVATEEGKSGVVLLRDSLAVLECRVRTNVDCGDHRLIIADVLEGRTYSDGEPWVHVRKNGLSY